MLDRDPALANDDSTQLSPLGWASFGNQVATASELIERGADPNAFDAGACGTALHAAAAMKYARYSRPFVAMLLQHGVDVSIRTTTGKTAAEIAEARAAQPDEKRPFKEIAAMLREV